MLPNAPNLELGHLRHKRLLEGAEAIAALQTVVARDEHRRILDVGCGQGYQRQLLEDIGNVLGLDIRKTQETQSAPYGLLADICKAPFRSGVFDVIHCSQVLSVLPDLDSALSEMRRIGSDLAVYVFIVPTRAWLLVQLPSNCLSKIRAAPFFLSRRLKTDRHVADGALEHARPKDTPGSVPGKFARIAELVCRIVLPQGQGERSYSESMSLFGRWKLVLERNGFRVLKQSKLLFYGPSEWPIVPTSKWPVRFGLSSSELFISVKSTNGLK